MAYKKFPHPFKRKTLADNMGRCPEHAYPLGHEDWQDEDGKVLTKKEIPKFVCPCGHKGSASELLGVDDEDNDLLWCPNCGRNGYQGWEWA